MNNKVQNALLIIGEKEDVLKLFYTAKDLGEINNVEFKKISYNGCPAIESLTNKQRDILITAKNNGYYNFPRKITTFELSELFGLSKATVIEHLRKAESKIISAVIEGG